MPFFFSYSLDCHRVTGFTAASRHALVKRTFVHVLRQYGFVPDAHEPRFSDGKGPDVCFQLGDQLALIDVTIVNPLAPSYVVAEAARPGATVEAAESSKDRRHSADADSRRMAFFPLALTTFGLPGPRTLQMLRRCASMTPHARGFMTHMMSALGVAVQRGNAGMINAAMASWWTFGVR